MPIRTPSPNTDSQRIYEYLVAECALVGEHAIHGAYKKFKKAPYGQINQDSRPPIPKAWIKKAWIRQNGKCNICKEPIALEEAAGDHIIPWSKGGQHKERNIAAVHDAKFGNETCNQQKAARGLIEESKRTGMLLVDTIPNLPEENDSQN